MKDIVQDAASKISFKMKEWIDQEINKLVPRWLQVLAMKDKTNIVKRLIGIQLEHQYDQTDPLKTTIRIYKHKKVVSAANFVIVFKGEK